MAAASGSAHTLNSATADTLPTPSPVPPMTTIRSSRAAIAGSRPSATATLVSGPRVTSVMVPGGCARIVSTRTSTACPGAGARPPQVEPDVAHPVRPVHVLRGVQRLQEGRRASGVHRHLAAGEVARVERVLHRLVERHVAGDDGQREHLDVRVPQRHQRARSRRRTRCRCRRGGGEDGVIAPDSTAGRARPRRARGRSSRREPRPTIAGVDHRTSGDAQHEVVAARDGALAVTAECEMVERAVRAASAAIVARRCGVALHDLAEDVAQVVATARSEEPLLAGIPELRRGEVEPIPDAACWRRCRRPSALPLRRASRARCPAALADLASSTPATGWTPAAASMLDYTVDAGAATARRARPRRPTVPIEHGRRLGCPDQYGAAVATTSGARAVGTARVDAARARAPVTASRPPSSPPAPRRRPTAIAREQLGLSAAAHEPVEVPGDEAQVHAADPTPPRRAGPEIVRCTLWSRATRSRRRTSATPETDEAAPEASEAKPAKRGLKRYALAAGRRGGHRRDVRVHPAAGRELRRRLGRHHHAVLAVDPRAHRRDRPQHRDVRAALDGRAARPRLPLRRSR